MRVIWGRNARRDLNEAISYLLEESVQAAELVGDRIHNAVQRLQKSPRCGRSGRIKGTRELVVMRTPYIVVYRIRSKRVEVVGVVHAARRWPAQFS
jgi:toxin ParE1/3/4